MSTSTFVQSWRQKGKSSFLTAVPSLFLSFLESLEALEDSCMVKTRIVEQ